jgi:hypothetical protein
MTMPSAIDTVVVAERGAATTHHAYVDWPAIIAGIVLAAAISLVMLGFGSAIGLSFANFHGGATASPIWIGVAAASWLLWVEVSAMLAGGYLTGRLRRRIHDATEHESDVRDGAHGVIVWAGTLLLGAIVAASGIGAAASAIGNVAGTVTTAAGSAAGAAASKSSFDPAAYFTDALFRPATPAPSATAATTATAPAGTTPATTMPAANRADATAEAGRILANGAINGSIPDGDKTYLAALVSANSGLSQADAKQRVDTVLSSIDTAKQKALDAAETARKAGIVGAFIIAASLLVAAAAAFWASALGGRHRDEQTVFSDFFRRF